MKVTLLLNLSGIFFSLLSFPIPSISHTCLNSNYKSICIANSNQGKPNISESNKSFGKPTKYGSLYVDFSSIFSFGTTRLTSAKNRSGKKIFLAINCEHNKINVTGQDSKWKEWISPVKDFEFSLAHDICNYIYTTSLKE